MVAAWRFLRNWDDFTDRVGFLAVLAYAFTAWSFDTLSLLTVQLCGVVTLSSREARARLGSACIFWLFVAFSLFMLIQTLRGAELFPNSSIRQWNDLGRWLSLFGFLPVAWCLKGNIRRAHWVLTAALAGLLFGMLMQASWSEVVQFRVGWQTGFQLYPPVSALIAATAILGLLLFFPRIFGSTHHRLLFLGRALAWSLALYLSAYILVASQSRNTWLAVALVFPGIFAYRLFRQKRLPTRFIRLQPITVLIVMVVIALGIIRNWGSFMHRTDPDIDMISGLLQGKINERSESSFSYRLRVQRFGLEKWRERPILGWGTGSSRPLIASSGRPELYNLQFGNWTSSMHNAYLEILIRFGVVGLTFFAAAMGIMIRALAEAQRCGRLPEDHGLFLAGSLAMTALWGFSDHFLLPGWCAYAVLLFGMGYTTALHPARTLPEVRKPSIVPKPGVSLNCCSTVPD